MNLQVSCAFAPCTLNIVGVNSLAIAPHFVSDRQQRFELVRNCRGAGVPFDILNQLFIATEMIGRDRAMDSVSKETVILRRNVRGDQFALSWRESAGTVEQDFRQFVQRFRGLRPIGHRTRNSR